MRRASRPRRLLLSATVLVAVLGGLAAALRAAAGISRLLAPTDGERSFASVAEAERHFRRHVVAPAYFPSSLQWPPVRVVGRVRAPRAVVLGFVGRGGGGEALLIAQSMDEGALPADCLLPPLVELSAERVKLAELDGTLARGIGEHGTLWREVRLTHRGRAICLRSRGSLEGLLRMARSLRLEGNDPRGGEESRE